MKALLFVLLTLCTANIQAGQSAQAPVVHGFVAQGIAQARHSNYINDSGELSAALTEAGINLSYQFSPSLRLASQGVYLNGGNRYPEGLRLDYLFLDWSLWRAEHWQLSAHLGRFKNYHWLHSATRDIPHARPSIVLPQSAYFDGFRDIYKGNDGVALVATGELAEFEWDAHWSYGKTPIDRSLTRNLLGEQATGQMEQVFDHQFSLVVRPFGGNSQFGMALVDSDFRYDSAPSDAFYDGHATTQRAMLTYRYQAADWEFSSEALYRRTYYTDLFSPGYARDTRSQGIYFQGRWFATDSLTLLARLDLFDANKDDRSGRKLEAQSGGRIPHYFGYMDEFTLGASYQLANRWQLRAEWHRFKGIARLMPVLIPNTAINDSEYWDLWAVQLIHWF